MTPDRAFDIVQRSYANGRLAHAYLVEGAPRGLGGALADRIAAMLLCSHPEKARHPCWSCDSCSRIEAGTHPDMLRIEPEKKSRVIGIDAIREVFLPWANKQSYSGGWKSAVFLFADRLNDASANAILKTLEEPPSQTLFLLVTDKPDALLPTIRSRCQRLDLSAGRIAPAEPWRSRTAEILAKHSSATALRQLATSARFVSLFEEMQETAQRETEAKIRGQASESNAPETDSDTLKALVSVREKEMRAAVYESIQDWYRDILLLSALRENGAEAQDQSLNFPEWAAELRAKSAKIKSRLAERFVEFAGNIERQIESRNMRPAVVFPHWFAWMR